MNKQTIEGIVQMFAMLHQGHNIDHKPGEYTCSECGIGIHVVKDEAVLLYQRSNENWEMNPHLVMSRYDERMWPEKDSYHFREWKELYHEANQSLRDLCAQWERLHVDNFNYPSYLPSFDEFVLAFAGLLDDDDEAYRAEPAAWSHLNLPSVENVHALWKMVIGAPNTKAKPSYRMMLEDIMSYAHQRTQQVELTGRRVNTERIRNLWHSWKDYAHPTTDTSKYTEYEMLGDLLNFASAQLIKLTANKK